MSVLQSKLIALLVTIAVIGLFVLLMFCIYKISGKDK